jgi:DNA replication and repair protein RecF
MMRQLAIVSLAVDGFRNLASAEIELGPRLNVLQGDNGQGKTNLLEALYVVATSKSFRTGRLAECIAHGRDLASIRARMTEEGIVRQQTIGIRPRMRQVRLDGKRPESLAAYAVMTPIVLFHPGSVALAAGPASERRRLLDRAALYRTPASLGDLAAYALAMKSRQRVLELRGEDASDLVQWEDLVVRHGLAVSDSRDAAAGELAPLAEAAHARIGSEEVTLTARYVRSAPRDAESYRALLAEPSRRRQDRARRSAGIGPHRDDLALELNGRPVRGVGSQGQQRAVVLALVMAEMALIDRARGVRPVLLLDDVSSELDRTRTAALLAAVAAQPGQVVLTTTRPALVETLGVFALEDRRDFRVVAGRVQAA